MTKPPKRRAGVIGWPVSHSLSPALHGHWLKRYGIEGEYRAIPAAPEALAQTLLGLFEQGFVGANITVPHKEAALTLVEEIDEIARSIGAVNTVVIKDGILTGTNTDAYGFIENLRPFLKPEMKRALVIGAGGAARAVVYGLARHGFAQIHVMNRTYERAEELAAMDPRIIPIRWDHYQSVMETADLLVNTTTQGMVGERPLEISLETLVKHALVTDIVYRPLITPLLAEARRRGNPVVDGLGMLLWQAKPGFAAWFGVEPQVDDDLRQAVLHAMEQQ